MFKNLTRQIENLIESVIELVYYMRGAISYEEMMNRTPGERDKIRTFIEKRLEAESKKMTPIY